MLSTSVVAEGVSVASGVSAAQLFDLASDAEGKGEVAYAETIYDSLAKDPDVEIRTEARFRHGRLLANRQRYNAAAELFRAILDEKPDAQRVRLELAKMQALIGKTSDARRTLRQAQAGGLPPEVAQVVDQFAAALRSLKPVSLSFEVALAPSTNVNRATTAKSLDTIIAPFDLSDDARAKSGLGLRSGGQVYARLPLGRKLLATARVSGQSHLYRDAQFNDAVASGQIGLAISSGKVQLRPQFGRAYRWYGGNLYSTTNSISVNAVRPLGKLAQLEVQGGVGWADYRTNNLQDGQIYDVAVSYEQAFTQRFGGSISLYGQRQKAADPGYSTTSGGVGLLMWHELGKTTAFVSANMSHLEADDRLFLFSERRSEWLGRLGVGAAFRQIRVAGFSPLVRITYERNKSTVGIYRYRSVSGDVGITRAF